VGTLAGREDASGDASYPSSPLVDSCRPEEAHLVEVLVSFFGKLYHWIVYGVWPREMNPRVDWLAVALMPDPPIHMKVWFK
jgi:hypothetical protein